MFEIMISTMLITTAFIVFFTISFKHCSENEILVVIKKSKFDSFKPYKIIFPGQNVLVIPFFQKYAYISLKTMLIEIIDNIFDENDNNESFSCVVAVSSNPEKWNIAAENLAGLKEPEIKEIAENIIRKELKEIKKEVTLLDFYIQENYQKYFKQINEKLNKVGIELKDI